MKLEGRSLVSRYQPFASSLYMTFVIVCLKTNRVSDPLVETVILSLSLVPWLKHTQSIGFWLNVCSVARFTPHIINYQGYKATPSMFETAPFVAKQNTLNITWQTYRKKILLSQYWYMKQNLHLSNKVSESFLVRMLFCN